MDGFNAEELETLLHAMFAIAWADRVFQEEEQVLLRAFVETCQMNPEQKARIDEWFEGPVALDAVDWSCLSAEAKAFVYVAAYRVAQADNRIVPEEAEMLDSIAASMMLPRETIEAIHANRLVPEGHWLQDAFKAPVGGQLPQPE